VGKLYPHWKKRKHHNLIGIRCWDIFSICQSPSQHFKVRKEMILDKLQNFALICSGFLERFPMGSEHGSRGRNPKRRFTESQEMATICTSRREIAAEVKGGLGFDLSPLFIPAGAIWALTIQVA
jgi:hypothetical protein